jgi:hypothetical protein
MMKIWSSNYGWLDNLYGVPDKLIFCERGLGITITKLKDGKLRVVYC